MTLEIGVYRGSFDPPHKGHFETVKHALSSGLANVIIIYSDQNPLKPFRTTDEIRKHLLNVMFKGLDQVVISDESYKATLINLETNPHVKKIHQIIAADLLNIPFRPIKHPTKLCYFILPRTGYQLNESATTHNNLPVKIAYSQNFTDRHHSSTEIRSLFFERKFEEASFKLPNEVLTTIIQNRYYAPTNNEFTLGSKFQEIKSTIENEITSKKLVHTDQYPLSLHLGNDIGLNGLSGDQVCFIKDKNGEILFVVKVFFGEQAKSNYESERLGFEIIKNLNLKTVKVPEIFFFSFKENYGYIGMNFIIGKSLAEIMSHNPEAIRLCARANLELHTAKRSFSNIVPNQFALYQKTFDNVCDKLNQLNGLNLSENIVAQLKSRWLKTCLSFEQNPGFRSYTHGDPNHYNWIVDLKNSTVTYIDLSLFSRSIDAKNEPYGFAVNELEEALLTFRLAGKRQGGISSSEIDEIKSIYEKEYLKNAPADITTGEARHFFSSYWILRIIENLTEKITTSSNVAILKYQKQLVDKIYIFLNN